MIHYLILVHNNLDQLERLIDKLKTSNSEIYIHMDKKISNFKKINGVYYIKNRQNISRWGSSMINAEIIWFSEIAKNMKKWDHIVLISWQCYPIKDIKYVENYIEDLGNRSCTSYRPIEKKYLDRINRYHFNDINFHVPKIFNNIILSIVSNFITLWYPQRVPTINLVLEVIVNFILPRRKYLINHYKIYRWDQRIVLSSKHVEYILNFLEKEEWKKFFSHFDYTSCSDEIFFQTILLNNENIKKEINNNLLWYIVREKNSNSPNTLTIKDYENIKKSDKLFARKFNINIDKEILEKLNGL